MSGALNMTLEGFHGDLVSPFDDVSALEHQARKLEDFISILSSSGQLLGSRSVLLVCYSGETSRLGCSILRNSDVEAYSLRGGFHAIIDMQKA